MSVPRERLLELKEVLLLGDPLDAEQRLDALAAVEYLCMNPPARRGRPIDKALRQRAGVVGVLVEKHGIPVKTALFAASPAGTERARAAVERAYRRLRDADEAITVPARAVRSALRLLGRP